MIPARVVLTGSSGFVGTSLVRSMRQERISTIVLRRSGLSAGAGGEATWDPYAPNPLPDPRTLAGVSGAVHLSGVNVAGRRWSPKYKREILESRVAPTRALALLLAGLEPRPAVMVCASAIGIYGERGDAVVDESSPPGSGFLAEVCVDWEKAAQPATDAGIRVVHLRLGVVLAPGGGALAKMLPLFRAGVGGQLGNGRQWMSWVALADAVRAIGFALATPGLAGPVNVVAPNPVTNREFTRVLAQAVHRPAVLPVPAFALRLAFGEMADASVLASTRVAPAKLQQEGFVFEYPELAGALEGAAE